MCERRGAGGGGMGLFFFLLLFLEDFRYPLLKCFFYSARGLCFYKGANCFPRPGAVRREASVSGSATSPVGLAIGLRDRRALNCLERSRPGEQLSVTADGFPELELLLLASTALRNPARNYLTAATAREALTELSATLLS